MKDLGYQQEAIKQLTELGVKLLDYNEIRQKLVFKAPTGSGKTYMTAMAMEGIADTIKSDPRHCFEKVAYVWLAPNRLHNQAFDSLKRLFAETRALNPIKFESISDGRLDHGDVLCLNWGSVDSEDNILVRDTEAGNSLWDVVENTRRSGTAIVAVIDEEHLHWDKRADKAASVLAKLRPIVEIRVSATPKTMSFNTVNVNRKDVVRAQMIKEGIVINPDIEVDETQDVEDYLIDEALKKRDLLAKCYQEMGKAINPLLLIQLPNDKATLTAEDKTMREQIVAYLSTKYAITTDNQELAVWLSDKTDKVNLEGIEKQDSPVKVLLFKEAIAKGWDCPRAAVLLIFRKLQSNEFAIQTLGRILRMPEQRYYFNPLLNKGYVYTNISADRIVVAGESEDYWRQNVIKAYRRENLNNISLPSVYEFYAASDRNRLGVDFRQFLYGYVKKKWLSGPIQGSLFGLDEDGGMIMPPEIPGLAEDVSANRKVVEGNQKVRFSVKGVTITIPKDLNIQNEESVIRVDDTLEYTQSNDKIYKIFTDYCRSLLTKYEKAASTPILAAAIIDVMEMLFALPEWETTRVVLSEHPSNNKAKFTDLFMGALEEYYPRVEQRKAEARERSFTPWMWEVPEVRMYNSDNNSECPEINNHALMPYVEMNGDLIQERLFAAFLERNSEYIDWWYKNGSTGRNHYAVEYYDPKRKENRLFYVDFIIRLKNGDIYLFDTKGSDTGGDVEDEEVLMAKHNALHDYVMKSQNPRLKAGSIIRNAGNDPNLWKYCKLRIDTPKIQPGWDIFSPDQLV